MRYRIVPQRSRSNGSRARGKTRHTAVMKIAAMYAVWRMELIITHLYGIMERLSRGESRDPGFLDPDSWPTIRVPAAMEIGNGEARCVDTGLQANDGLTGNKKQERWGTRTISGCAKTLPRLMYTSPRPTNKTFTYYFFWDRGWSITFSSLMSHGSRITTNGE